MNGIINRDSPKEDAALLDELWDIAGNLDANGHAAARDMYADDVTRLRRLEDKLSGQTPIAALLLTPLVAVLGVALHRSAWSAFACALIAAVYLASATYLTSTATQATRTAMPQPKHLRQNDTEHPLHEYSYGQLRAIHYNAPRGWQIANAIYGAQRCLCGAAIFLAAAAIFLAPGSFGSDTAQPTPKPSPTRTP